MKDKEKEKIENYQDVNREFKRIWKLCRVTVVPVIIDALGNISKDMEKWLVDIGVTCRLESLQKERPVLSLYPLLLSRLSSYI